MLLPCRPEGSVKRARRKRRLFDNCIGGPRLPESKRRTARLDRASTLAALAAPVASAARLVRAALRGAGPLSAAGGRAGRPPLPTDPRGAGMRRITNPKHIYVDQVGTVVDYEGEKHLITDVGGGCFKVVRLRDGYGRNVEIRKILHR